MTKHVLKTWPEFFERIVNGEKTFEVRLDDRGYQAGDTLVLREYDPTRDHECLQRDCPDNRWTGRLLHCRVGFVFKQGFGVDLGAHVVMSLLDIKDGELS